MRYNRREKRRSEIHTDNVGGQPSAYDAPPQHYKEAKALPQGEYRENKA